MCGVCERERATAAPTWASLWPVRDLGTHREAALAKAGVSRLRPRAASGFAVLVRGKPQRLRATARPDAIFEVVARMPAHPGAVADLYEAEAVGRGDRIVWRWIERVTLPAETQLVKAAQAPQQLLDIISTQLAGQLKRVDRGWSKPLLRRYLQNLDINWGQATGADIDRAFASADRVFRRAKVVRLATPWVRRVEARAGEIGRRSREFVRESFSPRIAPGFSQPDRRAIGQIGQQQGWWLRDEVGRRADGLTTRGRRIVEEGLKRGEGRYAIGRQLREQLPGMYQIRSGNYAVVSASVAMQRARNFSHVSGYRDAGFEFMEVSNPVDERTTEICRFMDGQIINVNQAYDLSMDASMVATPEDIKKVNPFMRTVNERGRRYIETARGTRMAEITRSGMGTRDDAGQHRQMLSSKQFPQVAAVGPPPYHHLCRSITVPVSGLMQVPRGTMPIALPMRPPTPPKPPPAAPGKPVAGLPRAAVDRTLMEPATPRARGVVQLNRPIDFVREPTPGHPTAIGWDPDMAPPFRDMGVVRNVPLKTQVLDRAKYEVRVVNEAIAKAQEANGGRVLSPKALGETIQGVVRGYAAPKAPTARSIKVARQKGLTGQLGRREAQRRYSRAMTSLSSRFQTEALKRDFPTIAVRPGAGEYTPAAIFLPVGGSAAQERMLIRLMTHHLDGIGSNADAAAAVREAFKLTGQLGRTDDYTIIRGRWGDVTAGKVYHDDPTRTDITATAHAATVPALATKLAHLWGANPTHIGFLLSWLRGAFF